MALVACKECGKEISKKAATCPHCGYKPKKTSLFTWFVTVFFGVPILLAVVIGGGNSGSSSGSSASTSQPSTSTKSPEQIAEERARDALMSLAMLGGRTLKESMRNPDSFQVESAIGMPTTNSICYTYRAQNGFGGMNVEQAVLTMDGEFKSGDMDGFAKLWNTKCANQSGTDFARYIR